MYVSTAVVSADGLRYRRCRSAHSCGDTSVSWPTSSMRRAEPFTIHCPNPGAMSGCADPGSRVWYSQSTNANRKYACTLEIVETSRGELVGVNPSRANAIVGEAIAAQRIGSFDGMVVSPGGADSRRGWPVRLPARSRQCAMLRRGEERDVVARRRSRCVPGCEERSCASSRECCCSACATTGHARCCSSACSTTESNALRPRTTSIRRTPPRLEARSAPAWK